MFFRPQIDEWIRLMFLFVLMILDFELIWILLLMLKIEFEWIKLLFLLLMDVIVIMTFLLRINFFLFLENSRFTMVLFISY